MTEKFETAQDLVAAADATIKYACGDCGAEDAKLWRQSHVFLDHVMLKCKPCCEKHVGKTLEQCEFSTDQIGSWIPAVPTPDRTSFWGYTSVPQEGVDWWHALPPEIRSDPA